MILAVLLAAATAATTPSDVEKLAWLAGVWREDTVTTTTRETWFGPTGGQMVSVTTIQRSLEPTRTELATITAEPAGVTFTAHVQGQAPTPFVMTYSGADGVVFENKAHDFPQRVIYRPCGVQLCARIEGVVGGQEKSQSWIYHRER